MTTPPDHWQQPPDPSRHRDQRESPRRRWAAVAPAVRLGLVALVVWLGFLGRPAPPPTVVYFPAPTQPTQPTRPVTVAPPPPPVTVNSHRAVRAPNCPDGTPALAVEPADAAAGTRYVQITVRNCSDTRTLTLQNPPTISVTTGRDQKSELKLGQSRPLQTIKVAPGGNAYFGFIYRGGGSSDDPEGRVNRIDYTVPEVGTASVLEFTDLAADSNPRVNAYRATPEDVFN